MSQNAEMPLVSVIITTYNRADLLVKRAVPSALNQNYRNAEIIVVDDGSKDNTREVLRPFLASGKIKYLFQENRGLSAARNRGVKESHGEFIIFLDDDDELIRGYIDAVVDKLLASSPEVAAVATGIVKRDEYGFETYAPPTMDFWRQNGMGNSWTVRRAVFENGVWFDESLWRAEDVDFMMNFYGRGFRYAIIPQPLFRQYAILAMPDLPDGSFLKLQFDQFVDAAKKINERYFYVYQREGPRALSWFYRFQGNLYCRAGLAPAGRRMLWKSFLLSPSLRGFYLYVAAMGGQKSFLFFFGLKGRVQSGARHIFLRKIFKKNTTLPRSRLEETEFTSGERFYDPAGHLDQDASGAYQSHLDRYNFAAEKLAGVGRVLDVACGSGYGSEILSQKVDAVVGIDCSLHAIKYAKERHKRSNINFILGNLQIPIPFRENYFDAVVSFETIEHLENQRFALQEFKRVLRRNGKLIISTPNKNLISDGGESENPFHVRELNKEEFISLLNNENFNIEELYGQGLFVLQPLWKKILQSIAKVIRYFSPLVFIKRKIARFLGLGRFFHKTLTPGVNTPITRINDLAPSNNFYVLIVVATIKK